MKIDTNRLTIFLSIVVLFILALGYYFMYLQWDFDDSYILYRVVKNILNGHGWVYNIGERHNASTSVLNTVLIALSSYFTGDIPLSAHIISALAVFGSGIIAYKLFRRNFGNNIALLAGYFLIRQLGGSKSWGLETNLFICFALLFVLLEEYRKNSWPVLGILVLTRPDGLLMVGLKWLKEFIAHRRYSIIGVLTVLVILTPWVIFSLYQFHQIFPDTFSQKIWQGRSGFWGTGHVYLTGLVTHYFLSSGLLLKVVLGFGVIGLLLMLYERSSLLYIVFFGLLQQTAYVIFNVPAYHWYFVLPDTMIYLAAFYGLGGSLNIIQNRYILREAFLIAGFFNLSPRSVRVLSLIVSLVLLASATLTLKSGYGNPRVDKRGPFYISIIKKIDTLYGPGRLAAMEVGSFGFHTDRTIVDIAGLTSPKGQFMTKERMDLFYGDPPELLLLHNPVWPHEVAIPNDYRFPVVYEFGMEFSNIYPTIPAYRLVRLYVRKDDVDPNDFGFQPDDRFSQDTLEPLLKGVVCLDTINRGVADQNPFVVLQRPLLYLQGWAVDIQRACAPANVFILLIHKDGQMYSLRADRHAREDVAKLLQNPVYIMSGFWARGATGSLPSGTYRIVIVQEVENTYYYVNVENRVQIP